MLKNWIKIAFRQYKRNWLSTLVNILGLCLGLSGFILCVLYWQDAESWESWNPKKRNVFFLQPFSENDKEWGNNMSFPIVHHAKQVIPEVEDYLLLRSLADSRLTARNGRSTFEKNAMSASESFFRFFPFKLKAGSYNNIFSDLHSIAIEESVSKKLFGSEKAIGKQLNIDDSVYLVKAVYALPEGNSAIKPQFVILAPDVVDMRRRMQHGDESWGNYNFQGLLKLKEGAEPANIASQIYNKVILGISYKTKNRWNMPVSQAIKLYGPNAFELTQLDKTHLYARGSLGYIKENLKTVMIMLGLSSLVVLLSAINFINLKTAEASQRAREVGVRKVLGATRWGLIKQFTLEALILCLFSYVISLVIVELSMSAFNKLMDSQLSLYNVKALSYSFLTLISIALISGLIPAIYIANFKELNTLKGNFSRSRHGILLRNGILTLQLLISSFFIICGLVTYKQVSYLMARELGFKGNQIMEITLNDSRNINWKKYEFLKSQLIKIRGVREVSYGESTPSRTHSSSNIDYQNRSITGYHGSMDYNFLSFSGVPILAGRNISVALASDSVNVIVVNESFARSMGWTNKQAIGKEVKPGFDNKKYKIIGIAADYTVWSAQNRTPPIAFFHYKATPWKRNFMDNILVKVSPDEVPATVQRIKKYWNTVAEPGYPFNYYFIDQKFARSFEVYKRQEAFFFLLNIIVLCVALLGLFALASLIIDQKLKGIAIRKTLGASNRNIVMELVRQFLIIATLGVVISIPISYYFMNEWLKDFYYRISMPVFPYFVSMASLLLLTFIVVSIKAYRTAESNLLDYLKYE